MRRTWRVRSFHHHCSFSWWIYDNPPGDRRSCVWWVVLGARVSLSLALRWLQTKLPLNWFQLVLLTHCWVIVVVRGLPEEGSRVEGWIEANLGSILILRCAGSITYNVRSSSKFKLLVAPLFFRRDRISLLSLRSLDRAPYTACL